MKTNAKIILAAIEEIAMHAAHETAPTMASALEKIYRLTHTHRGVECRKNHESWSVEYTSAITPKEKMRTPNIVTDRDLEAAAAALSVPLSSLTMDPSVLEDYIFTVRLQRKRIKEQGAFADRIKKLGESFKECKRHKAGDGICVACVDSFFKALDESTEVINPLHEYEQL